MCLAKISLKNIHRNSVYLLNKTPLLSKVAKLLINLKIYSNINNKLSNSHNNYRLILLIIIVPALTITSII